MTRLRGVLPYREATTVVKHCGVSAGGVLRAYVKPAHLGALSYNLQQVLEGKRWKCFVRNEWQ